MKIILLDSNSLINRAYFALSHGTPLTNKKGQPTGAIHGFFAMLLKLIEEEAPTHIGAAFDVHAPTFRHALYTPYKGTRKPMPEDLVPQFPEIKKLLKLMDVAVLEKEGFEADDILGTLANKFDAETIIVTGDRDCLQLVSDTTKVYLTVMGISKVEKYDLARLAEEGFTPESFLDYKALRGDCSDNIPGIPGIGEKTAKTLLDIYKTLDKVLDSANEMKGALAEKIASGREIALLSKQLATINRSVPLDCGLDTLAFKPKFSEEFLSALAELELAAVYRKATALAETKKDFEVKPIAADYETVELETITEALDALRPMKEVGLLLSDAIRFASSENREYVLTPAADLFGGPDFDSAAAAVLGALNGKKTYVYDLKKLLKQAGAGFGEGCFDVMVAAHLDSGSRAMKTAADALFGYGFKESAAHLFSLGKKLEASLVEKRLWDAYKNIEFPLIFVLKDMEAGGFAVEKGTLLELDKKYTEELTALTEEIYRDAGQSFNINSPKQMGEILFDKLDLRRGKKTKSGYSVDADILEKLSGEHPIIDKILRYRRIMKLKSTYIDGLVKLIGKDGRIRTVFNQCVTSTGRLSSTEPNLQNIPVRTAEGRELRRAFTAAPGGVLISADYSQIELRLLAHFSGDSELIKAYRQNDDIHTLTASEIFGVGLENVTPEMRSNAKAVNFGIIYGISAFGLASNISIPTYIAREFIEKYFMTYPKVKEYMDGNVAYARENGYIRSLSGRIRDIPELRADNHNVRAFGERIAMNMPLQGTAADLIKIAMIKVHKRLANMKSKLILQVHDELIVDAAPEEAEEVKSILKEEMENAAELSVPLIVNIGAGKNWFDAK
jgi:DNA polymerase-1